MNTRRAVSLLILSVFIFSLLGVVAYADLIDDVTGRAGEVGYLPDIGGVDKTIADFGGVNAADWYMVPMTILILVLIIYLLLRKSVFKAIAGGMGGYTEEVICAIIAICLGTLAVYKTAIAFWVAQFGKWGVIIMGIVLLFFILYWAYTGGRGAFGHLRQEHLQGLAGRKQIIAKAQQDIAGLKREAYLTTADEKALSKMEEVEKELMTEDIRLVQMAERLRQQLAQAMELWKGQRTMFGSSAKVRAEILRILPEVKWLKAAVEDAKKREEKLSAPLARRIEGLTINEEKLAGLIEKRTNGLIKLEGKEINLDKTLRSGEKKHQGKWFRGEKLDALAGKEDYQSLKWEGAAKKIEDDIRRYTDEAREISIEVEKFQEEEKKLDSAVDVALTKLCAEIGVIYRWVGAPGVYISEGTVIKSLPYFQAAFQAAGIFEREVRALYSEERKELALVKEIEAIEKRIEGLERQAIKELVVVEREEIVAEKEEAPIATA